MYNEELKKKYLKAFNDRNLNLTSMMTVVFNQLEKYESSLDKDACSFTAPEILGFYKYLCTPSVDRIYNINIQLKFYTAYCLENGQVKDGSNHYAELPLESLFTCVNTEFAKKRIVSKAELYEVLSTLNNAVDKVLLLGQFEGINGNGCSEFIGMKNTDIKGNTIYLNSGRKFEISNHLVALIEEAADTFEYYGLRMSDSRARDIPTYQLRQGPNDRHIVFKVRVNGNVGTDMNPQILERRMIVLRKHIGAEFISRKALQASGRIEFIKQTMKEKNISFDEALRDKEVNTRYTKINSVPLFKEKYGRYFEGI